VKRYANGYDAPQFEYSLPNGLKVTVTLSLEYQGLVEYEEDVTTVDEFTDGSKEAITHFYRYEWRLFYSDEISLEERKKIAQIQEAVKAKYPMVLIPHKDYPWRKFEVLISPEKRSMELGEFFAGEDETTNLGYEISFVNKQPITKIDLIDPNIIPVVSARVYYEF
jgi:hypothetical protein